jgi:hypothetical protein
VDAAATGLQRFDAHHGGDTTFLTVATAPNTGSIELWAIDRNKTAPKWKRLLVGSNHMERKQNMFIPFRRSPTASTSR